ncbi:MAG: dipeptide epimerase [Nitrospira sp.]|nr:MAG: dipeptide epimerase [Nitrospira sp.]
MRLMTIAIYRLCIPFTRPFRHARCHRHASDAVIVRLEDRDGVRGYGEGLARPYVTGEGVSAMIRFINTRLAPALFELDFDVHDDPFEWVQQIGAKRAAGRCTQTGVVAWHAAHCAVELALLDWALRRTDRALTDYLPPARTHVTYSGVISADSPEDAASLARRFVTFGITRLKVKIGTEGDEARLQAIRNVVGPSCELRADANGAWTAEQAVRQLARLEPYRLTGIEQPVAAGDIAGMCRVKRESGIPVAADESLVTRDHALNLARRQACDLFNIRISKCGGIARSLDIAAIARTYGIGMQVGAQVGETALLSAAGRHLAASLPEVAYVEGSFGTRLLSEDIAEDNPAFGFGGEAPVLPGIGLGVTVDERALDRFAVQTIVLNR